MRRALLQVELLRLRRDPVGLLVIIALPVVFYLGFALGVPSPGADRAVVRANLMVGMASYGAATAASSLAGQAAVDRVQGWGRQLALTRLRDVDHVLVRGVTAAGAGLLPTVVVYLTGALTGVRMSPTVWLLSGALVVLGAWPWALYGMAVGLAGRTQSATAAASAGLVLFAFVGDVFLPLSGVMQQLGRLSPMYGSVQLARFPIDRGRPLFDGQLADPWWQSLLVAVAWGAIFALLAVRQVARSRERG